LKSQIAELYKAQNTHLQTIKSLETGLSSLQQAETQLKQEFQSFTFHFNVESLISKAVKEILNSEQLYMAKLSERKINKYKYSHPDTLGVDLDSSR
jgi:hypothetical protein